MFCQLVCTTLVEVLGQENKIYCFSGFLILKYMRGAHLFFIFCHAHCINLSPTQQLIVKITYTKTLPRCKR